MLLFTLILFNMKDIHLKGLDRSGSDEILPSQRNMTIIVNELSTLRKFINDDSNKPEVKKEYDKRGVSLHDMDLGDVVELERYVVTRVPGGWLFNRHASYHQSFVPYTEDMRGHKLKLAEDKALKVFRLNEVDIRQRAAECKRRILNSGLTTNESIVTYITHALLSDLFDISLIDETNM